MYIRTENISLVKPEPNPEGNLHLERRVNLLVLLSYKVINCAKGTKCDHWHVADCMFYPQGLFSASPCIWLHRDQNRKIVNLGNPANYGSARATAKGTAKAVTKPKAKGKAKASVCVASEEFPSGVDRSRLD